MIRLLLLALFCYLAYTLYHAFRRSIGGPPDRPPKSRSPEGEEMVRDPQCGTFVPKGDALSATARGKRHYFCSSSCRDAFLKNK